MSFSEFDGKKEVRFGDGPRKFIPDSGKYILEIQDDMAPSFNEKSGNTSVVFNFKTITQLFDPQDGTNLNIGIRQWITPGVKPAERKLKAIIAYTGQAKYFDENYEDIPAMDSEKWVGFMKDLKDKLSFKLIGAEMGSRKFNEKNYADITAFFAPTEPKKVRVKVEQEEFAFEG